jgi:hypothetical protein
VCSPHARNSAYVNDEIRRFAALNGVANIVPMLIAGVPNNEADTDQEIYRAFPDALCELFKMSVASDFRGCDLRKERINRGRFEAEWFKTLANLLDEKPAAVEQRERKRRARFLKLGFAASALVIGLLTVAWVITLISRREAVYQRAQVQRTAAQADFDLALVYSRGSETVDPRLLAHLARALRTKPDAALPRQYLIRCCGTCLGVRSRGNRCDTRTRSLRRSSVRMATVSLQHPQTEPLGFGRRRPARRSASRYDMQAWYWGLCSAPTGSDS